MRNLPIKPAPRAAPGSRLPSRMVTICGATAWAFGVHFAALMACEYKQSLYLCGDNRFDPYSVAGFSKAQQINPEEALKRILVARAFTAFQLDELIYRLNPEEGYQVVIVSGVCTAFYDEDVIRNDAARMFYRSLWRLSELARQGLTLLLTQSETPKHTARSYFLTDLYRASDEVIQLDSECAFTLENLRSRLMIAE